MNVRKRISYEGRVQGVGFRYTAVRTAANYAVTGYVRNMVDGGVEVVVEGEADHVGQYVVDLEERLGQYIRGKREVDEGWRGDFAGFDVRY